MGLWIKDNNICKIRFRLLPCLNHLLWSIFWILLNLIIWYFYFFLSLPPLLLLLRSFSHLVLFVVTLSWVLLLQCKSCNRFFLLHLVQTFHKVVHQVDISHLGLLFCAFFLGILSIRWLVWVIFNSGIAGFWGILVGLNFFIGISWSIRLWLLLILRFLLLYLVVVILLAHCTFSPRLLVPSLFLLLFLVQRFRRL